MPLLRSTIALLGGFAIFAFLWMLLLIVATAVLGAGDAPTRFTTTLVCFGVAAFAGGHATAALAPFRPRAHSTGLAIMILAMSLSLLIRTTPGAPRWYGLGTIVIGPLLALAGGVSRRVRSRTEVTA